MTLRDWYAGQALLAVTPLALNSPEGNVNIAKRCWDIADAMCDEAQRRRVEPVAKVSGWSTDELLTDLRGDDRDRKVAAETVIADFIKQRCEEDGHVFRVMPAWAGKLYAEQQVGPSQPITYVAGVPVYGGDLGGGKIMHPLTTVYLRWHTIKGIVAEGRP